MSSTIARKDYDHVVVTVGDADLVESSMGLQLGTDAANVSVGSEKSLTEGKTRQVEIDVSTPEGQRAYQSFVKTGELPKEGAGVANERSSRVIDYSANAHVDGKLGDIEPSLIARDQSGQIVETTNPDGTTSYTRFARENEVGLTQNLTIGADGKLGKSTYSLRLQDVSGSLAGALDAQAGHGRRDQGTKDVTLNFDDDDLRRMRSAAVDQLEVYNPDLSRDEITEILARGPNEADKYLSSPDSLVKTIALTENPAEIVGLIAGAARGDSDHAADWLFNFNGRTTDARHPDGSSLGDHPEDSALPGVKLSGPGC